MMDLGKFFFTAPSGRPWIVLLCLITASTLEGIGIVALLPLLSVAASRGAEPDSVAGRLAFEWVERIGIEPSILNMAAVVAGTMVLKSAVTLIAMRYVGNTAADVATNLRLTIIRRLLRVRWSYLIGQPIGRITNTISADATRASQAYVEVATFLALTLQTVAYTGVALLVSWQLAALALILAFVVGAALHFLVRIAKRAGSKQTQRQQALSIFLNDTLGNLKPIRAMGKDRDFVTLLENRVKKVRGALRRQVSARELLSNLQDAIFAVVFMTIFVFATTYLDFDVATFLVSGIVLVRVTGNIGKLQKSYQKAVLVESAYYAAQKLVDEVSAQPEILVGQRAPVLERAIRFEGVTFSHGERATVHDIDLEIRSGALTVLTGPSGAGKSTLIDLLLGLHTPDAGSILLDGVPLVEIDLTAWRRTIGYVPQEVTLLHDTILHNITLGDRRVGEDDVREALELVGAWDFVQSRPGGLSAMAGERGGKLSGGQRQRLALARALVVKPKLLILDEVTSALDPATGTRIARRIETLRGRTTVLAVTHRSEFVDIADRVVRIDNGRIVQLIDRAMADHA